MAFFGLTQLGYQNPIGDKMIVSPRGQPPPQAPDQLYIMPLTDNQQYGWMLSKSSEPWTRVQQFPRRTSEITKFVDDMSMRDPEFSLF